MVMRGWNVIGIDISPAAARLSCKAALGMQGTGAFGALIANATGLPFQDNIFDAVVAHHILGHLDAEGRQRAASEIARVLICGGCLYFLEFSQEDFRYGKGAMTEPGTFLRGDGISTHYFCGDEIRALFPKLSEEWLGKKEWCIRISGTQYQRSEISAIFAKKE
jgi:SAM-dependent methyltransferase